MLAEESSIWALVRDRVGLNADEIVADAQKVSPSPIQAIYIGGSLGEGYGNTRSDVDVYVLIDEETARDHRVSAVSSIKSRFLQYDLVTRRQLDSAIAQFAEKPFEDAVVSLATNQVLHRICNSIVLMGAPVVSHYRELLTKARYRAFSSFVKEEQSENALQDAYGTLEAGQLETAVFNIRLATHRAFEAILSLLGQTATNDKWVFEKIRIALGNTHPAGLNFVNLYAEMPQDFKREAVGRYFEKCLAFVQRCREICLLATILRPSSDSSPLPTVANTILQWKDEPSIRRPDVHLRRIRGKNIVSHAGRPRRALSDRAALVWSCLSIRHDVHGAIEVARAAAPELFSDQVSEDFAQKLKDQWTAAGMIA